MKIDLCDKIALVTGGAGMLGRVMIRSLAACGADVVIHYNTKAEKAQQLKREAEAMGRQAYAVQADITDLTSVLAMRDQIQEHFGKLPHIIVANAVAQYKWTSILEQQPADYESQFKTCVMQSVYLAKAFMPALIERRAGRFIGINTECAMQNFPTQSAYVAGKRGMDGVYRILAKEVGEYGITVNQVAPGWTFSDRDRERGFAPPLEDGYLTTVPMKRRGTDQEIANTVAFLASDLASFISGVYIPVCGGNVMPAI
ncbi:SDR family NAD(P)-dependent oxidoreductase [Paenibacillus piri]|uniref:SDR family oxidoreductase n=1 Tax=Paenibacillus piri TaxID=2547395 RepID=A0A4R5KI22_9BACL|nr:SDR family oxidoreductase [Paenibacillus piri]TDF95111.1 SDR family oxidoreductase [Paenibacillus piri]